MKPDEREEIEFKDLPNLKLDHIKNTMFKIEINK